MTRGADLPAGLRLAAANTRLRRLMASHALDLAADWTSLVALLALSYELTGDVRAAALVLLGRILPRAVLAASSTPPSITGQVVLLALVARTLAFALLALADGSGDLGWMLPLVMLASVTGFLVDGARGRMMAGSVPRVRLGLANWLCGAMCRVVFVVGPLLGGIAILLATPNVALLVAAALVVVAAALVLPEDPASATAGTAAPEPGLRASLRTVRATPALLVAAGAEFVNGVVAVSLQLTLVALLIDTFERSHAALGVLFAATGVGMLLGPLPVPKLLLRLPAVVLLVGNALLLTAALPFTHLHASLAVAGLTLIAIGVIGITTDLLATTLARRSVAPGELSGAVRVLNLAVMAGQVAAAGGVVLLAGHWIDARGMLVVALLCVALMAALLLRGGARQLLVPSRPVRDARG